MAKVFRCYGLHLSANRMIPELVPAHADTQAEVHLHFGGLPHGLIRAGAGWSPEGTGSKAGRFGRPEAIAWPRGNQSAFRLRYEDSTTFVIDPSASRIWAVWPPALSFEDTVVYLLGPVLAFVLRLRGIICLHASAVAMNGQAVAFIGPSGAGKSTAAAAFARRGVAVLTDDLLALGEQGGGVVVHPGYARLRLWPESVDMLYDRPATLPALTPNWDKRYLDLQRDRDAFERHSLPLGAIYLLDLRCEHPAAPFVQSLGASESFLNLLANVRGEVHLNKQAHRRAFGVLGRLARRLPIRRVIGRTGRNALPSLCEAIAEDLQSPSGAFHARAGAYV